MFKSKYSFHFAKHNGQSWELDTQFCPSPNHFVMLCLHFISCWLSATQICCRILMLSISTNRTLVLPETDLIFEERLQKSSARIHWYQRPAAGKVPDTLEITSTTRWGPTCFFSAGNENSHEGVYNGKNMTEMSAKTTTAGNTCQAGKCRQDHPWHAHLDAWKHSWILKNL